MISFLAGEIIGKDKESVVVLVGSVGLRAFVPAAFLASAGIGENVQLYTHLHLREKEIALYGFASPDEVKIFELLLGVPGVGPKNALALISSMSPDAIRGTIGSEDVPRLSSVPGIGAKTARKIILELREKIGFVPGSVEALSSLSEADAQVIEALTSLGYSLIEAQRAVQMVPPDVVGVEERLRAALATFGKQV